MKKAKRILAFAIPVFIILFCACGFLFAPNDPNHVDLAKKNPAQAKSFYLEPTTWEGVFFPGCCTVAKPRLALCCLDRLLYWFSVHW